MTLLTKIVNAVDIEAYFDPITMDSTTRHTEPILGTPVINTDDKTPKLNEDQKNDNPPNNLENTSCGEDGNEDTVDDTVLAPDDAASSGVPDSRERK